MAKKKRKKTERKRDLKYGNVVSQTSRKDDTAAVNNIVEKAVESSDSIEFKKELKRNLVFVFSFLGILLAISFILAQTNILEPLLQVVGLGGLYHQ
jgi:hypothetical protein